MRTAKACAYNGCLEYSRTTDPYCPTHQRIKAQYKNSKRRNRPGDNAAARARRIIRQDWDDLGIPTVCNHCGTAHTPEGIELDHIVALIDGGTNHDTNLQALCKPCHVKKSTAEAAQRKGHTSL